MKNDGSVLLETRGLTAGYEKKIVLQGVELSVRAGEVLALIGPNGAGKSTFIKSIAGQLARSGGTVFLCGKDLRQMTPGERSERMSVLLTGQPAGELVTCREMAAAGRYPYTGRLGILSPEDWEKVDAAMARMGAADLADLPFDGISDGQRQRVLLARALCQEPKVLVLDEPASFLDIRYQLELVAALRSLTEQEDLAVIISLHELDLVRRCADRILCLKDGRADRLGSAAEIFADGYLEQLYDLPAGSLEPAAPAPGKFSHYIRSEGKQLRCGYTTGTCAALAAAGAAARLLMGVWPETVSLRTPKGPVVQVGLEMQEISEDGTAARCGVRKDAGDDVDITAGLLICAEVRRAQEPGILIRGGRGVGRVTRPGLDQPVGEAAINSVPRQMIREALEEVCRTAEHDGGLEVTVFVPGGEEAAEKTFNPKLGIEGGISILGTSGIVEPMSRQALTDTIALELRQHFAEGHRRLILTPGNYGMDYLRGRDADTLGIPVVKCSNFIGEALDEIRALGYEELLLAGHIGKLVKLAGGIMNTHSRQADCRRELFVTYAALAGAGRDTASRLMECATTDACIDVLKEDGLLQPVMDGLRDAILRYVSERAGENCHVEIILFSNVHGTLAESEGVKEVLRR